ncbi:murein biosynthesis integral membrane protein MurJ [Nocardioides sp. CFH 31398]|uniref:murein biosynthesis integral membrane protein MurJ n=1 Tax=Nocardioides sp. CFH 31398 TaxID=2919579 RepID=UPI001F063CEE|nr:murein biosynthesis integral membrane protein MurJ [Nocardioides sp. CFH 31398]MCH1865711.1 murein biosynthesis integral membrane protein MurJ [Nocardioides sp. CFH 31398]
MSGKHRAGRPVPEPAPEPAEETEVPTPATEPRSSGRSLLASSAIMAAGTVFSRLSGLIRALLLAAALGNQLLAEQFAIGNTIPNMVYILLAGGVFNAVLVPQLVRAMKSHDDGGEAYTNRIVTLAALFLGVVTVLLVLGAPWVMAVYLDPSWSSPELAAQRASVIDFARYCLPQVFFYGMFVLVGQILNSRGRFGPMMWAPIANNAIAIGVLLAYLVLHGPASGDAVNGAYTSDQEVLLGVGSTFGIVAQLLILLPYLRAAGFRFRPRFDFRDSGLGHTLRLGSWTVLFVVVNQLTATMVVRLASSGSAASVETGAGAEGSGTGYVVYSTMFLVAMVPHSVITVSLATAVLPTLSASAADGDLRTVASTLAGVIRRALSLMVPIGLLLPVLAPDAARAAAFGAVSESYELFVPTLALFGPAVVLFTVHYLVLRGFYALERTRTVFFVQCTVAATNIAVAVTGVALVSPEYTSPALVVAYGASYAVGSVVSYTVLRRTLGGLETRRLLGFLARLGVAVVVSTGVTLGVALLLREASGDPGQLLAAVRAAGLTVLDLGLLLVLGRLLRVSELADVAGLLTRRLRRRR